MTVPPELKPYPRATAEGTARYAARFPAHDGFFRSAQEWTVSSLGIGSYLGEMDDRTDAAYTEAVRTALDGGVNFVDTSLNYRHQRSERAIGRALKGRPREEVVICTKAGFLVPGAVPGALRSEDVAGRMHSMAPHFLADQLERSLANLGVEAVDVFYLHNPETQIRFIGVEAFDQRIGAAFETLERLGASGKLRYYGAATWDGFRRNGAADGLSLARMAGIAERIGGAGHRFRFIQLPFNLEMKEAYAQKAEIVRSERMRVLDAAHALGITVVSSASILQARFASGLAEPLREALGGLPADACRAIQFARSAPHVTVALVGMSQPSHVRENLGVAAVPPLTPDRFAAVAGA